MKTKCPVSHLVTDPKEKEKLRNFYIEGIGKWKDSLNENGEMVLEYDMVTVFGKM